MIKLKRRITQFFIVTFALLSLSTPLFSAQYIGGWGGVAFVSNRLDKYSIDFDPGIALGICYGIECMRDFRLETELNIRRACIRDIRKKSGLNLGMKGTFYEGALLCNALYAPRLFAPYIPYIGFGIGWEAEKTRLSHAALADIHTYDNGFSAQLLCGLEYQISRCYIAGISYRYYLFDDDVQSSAVVGSLTYRM